MFGPKGKWENRIDKAMPVLVLIAIGVVVAAGVIFGDCPELCYGWRP